jgi:hypothetical protein
MLSHQEWPWHEIWLPMNAGTLPFWWLVLIWIFGFIAWLARPLLRDKLLCIGILLLVLLPGAALWSFLFNVSEATGLTEYTGEFDPAMVAGEMELASGSSGVLLAVFLLLTLISATLVWRHLATRCGTHASGLEASPSQRDD